jgi:membrane-associated phospholipid phosphatase
VIKIPLDRQQREWLIPFFAYLVIVVVAYWRVHELQDSDFAFLLLILVAFALGRLSNFIRDWTPVVLLFFSYEYLHGYADKIVGTIHSTDVIQLEEKLFGTPVASATLQRIFYTPGNPHWYDYATAVLYGAHSFVVLFIAFGLWIYRRELYFRWAKLFIYLSFAGFITYVLFPAMPPWMAAHNHLIPSIHKIVDEIMPDGTVGVVNSLNSNLVAAMPSLHAAYPTLGFLFMLRYFRKFAALYALYCLSVYVGVVYAGEHFIVDVIAGIIYAAAVFFLEWWIVALSERGKAIRLVPTGEPVSVLDHGLAPSPVKTTAVWREPPVPEPDILQFRRR